MGTLSKKCRTETLVVLPSIPKFKISDSK